MGYDLEQLKSRADIVEVARALGLDPKKEGANYVARCPAHTDQGRPNLYLNQGKGAKCFRCNFHADVIGLVAKARGVDLGEAMRWLAQYVGLQPDQAPTGRSTKGRLGYGKGGRGAKAYPKPGAALPDPDRLALAASDHVDDDQVAGSQPSMHDRAEEMQQELPAGDPFVADLPGEGAAPHVCTQTPAAARPAPWSTVTLVWPADTTVPMIAGKWQRLEDGRIEATYTREELAVVLWAAGAEADPVDLARALGDDQAQAPEPAQAARRLTLRATIYRALLGFAVPILPGQPVPAGAAWLRDHKGLTLETQAEAGLCWLEDWATADRELKATFGVDVLKGLGLLTDRGNLHFSRHRLLFPFWLRAGDDLAPVYVQGRDVTATDKRYRFDNPSGPVPCPYNWEAVRRARATGQPVFLCEGATDTLTLTQSGRLAAGIVGAQGFKSEWAKHFADLVVFLAFDPDEAGQGAAREVAGVFVAAGLPSPRVVKLPEGQDVTDFFTGKATKKPSEGGRP